MIKKVYLCIDLKTFYASVECAERKLDPFKTNLVVADPSRGNGALCLAVTPALKAQGVKNRCRIYEIPENIKYITAIPRMRLYMEYSANIYSIYLKYIAKEDIHVYSVDEAFLDITSYLRLYNMSARQIARMIMDDVFKTTGITATAGIGTNMYLAKVALDIISKHTKDNMGILTEELYKELLWQYKPLTDFWQIGNGTAKRLAKYDVYDMYGIAHMDEDILYKEFGITAKYLIDHAWGLEPITIEDIHNYRPKNNSISHSQILFEDYDYVDALNVVKEMVELKVLDMVGKHLVSNHISLFIGYSKNVIPSTGGSRTLTTRTNSYRIFLHEFVELFEKTTNRHYPIRTIAISFGGVLDEIYETYDLFTDIEALEQEKKLGETLVQIRDKYGKSAIFKGMNLLEKSTTIKRNELIGGHNAQ